MIEERPDTFFQIDSSGVVHEISNVTGELVQKFEYKPEAKHLHKFTPVVADVILQRISEGQTLSYITGLPGMPSMFTINKWRAMYPDFQRAMEVAESSRAERVHDRIYESLEDTRSISKDEVPAEKLWFDKARYLAKVGNREKFGERDKMPTNGGGNVTIILDTGIKRNEDAIPAEVLRVVQNQNKE